LIVASWIAKRDGWTLAHGWGDRVLGSGIWIQLQPSVEMKLPPQGLKMIARLRKKQRLWHGGKWCF